MPTKITVGLCKKRGLPEFGSVGANCHVEIELDAHVLEDDPASFRQHVRRAYNACRESVEAELSREPRAESGHGNGQHDVPHRSNGRKGNRRSATQSQVRAINAIANRKGVDLASLLRRFNVRTADQLSIGDASSLIDELKGPDADKTSKR